MAQPCGLCPSLVSFDEEYNLNFTIQDDSFHQPCSSCNDDEYRAIDLCTWCEHLRLRHLIRCVEVHDIWPRQRNARPWAPSLPDYASYVQLLVPRTLLTSPLQMQRFRATNSMESRKEILVTFAQTAIFDWRIPLRESSFCL